jgi:hypothetical protein
MPNRGVHFQVGAAAGGFFAAHRAQGQPNQYVLPEVLGGILGGVGGGLLPDLIDTPDSPHHRAGAHSVSITGAAGYYVSERLSAWQASLRDHAQHFAQMRAASPDLLAQIAYSLLELFFRFLAGALAGLLAGYASHLVLDSFTPSSLPILC